MPINLRIMMSKGKRCRKTRLNEVGLDVLDASENFGVIESFACDAPRILKRGLIYKDADFVKSYEEKWAKAVDGVCFAEASIIPSFDLYLKHFGEFIAGVTIGKQIGLDIVLPWSSKRFLPIRVPCNKLNLEKVKSVLK
jgi:hypothetical protein